jgi:hypothetical protein
MALQVVFLQDKARLHRRCHVHAQGRPERTVGPQQRRTLKSLEIDLCTTGTRDGVNLTSTIWLFDDFTNKIGGLVWRSHGIMMGYIWRIFVVFQTIYM